MTRILRTGLLPRRSRRTRLMVQALECRIAPATFNVINALDSGIGTFRQAISDANGTAGTDDIVFDPTFFAAPHTISLLTAVPSITQSVNIVGTSAAKCVVQRGAAVAMRIITSGIAGQGTITISNLTISGGSANQGGGIFSSDDNFSLTNCVVANNVSTASGGGIATAASTTATLTLTNCTLSGNSSANEGGAVYNTTGKLVMDGCTVSGNTASGIVGGGGIYLFNNSATIRNSTITSNRATSFPVHTGGGGGIEVRSTCTVTVQNCTIAYNIADDKGGGIHNVIGTLSIESTIVAKNIAVGAGNDIYGGLTAKYCLIGVRNDGPTFTPASTNNQTGTLAVPLNPLLGLLANNGGPTQTLILYAGSPAIDAGSNPSALISDQRGPGFWRTQGAATDIGSFESPDPASPSASGSSPDVSVGGGTSQTLTVVYTDNAGSQLINFSSLGTGDVIVSGPGGSLTPTLITATPSADAKSITATYVFTPPGGAWDLTDNGTYSINVVPVQIVDKDTPQPFPVAGGTLASFAVAIPIVVNAINDETVDTDGKVSLREALAIANANPGADIVTFDDMVFATTKSITLALGAITISDAVTISGSGPGLLTVSGNQTNAIFYISAPAAAKIGISGMTLTGGKGVNGGAIYGVNQAISLSNCVLADNTANNGGAVFLGSNGSFTAIDCSFLNNTAKIFGGAIDVSGPGSKTILIRCTVSGNTATTRFAGGIYARSYFLLDSCTVSGNSAPDGVYGAAGGLALVGPFIAGGLTIRNSTISGNSAGVISGGMEVDYPNTTLVVQNSTITDNSAPSVGGLRVYGGPGSVSLESTIVQNNVPGGLGADIVIQKSSIAAKNSAIGSYYIDMGSLNDLGGNLFNTPINLGPLADNGGPTRTHALLPLSSCINAGSNPAALTTDQRGAGFPRQFGAAIDIGAYEVPYYLLVTTDADSGPGTLRQAILDANTITGADTITFDPVFFATAKTITLTSGELQIAGSTIIQGPGASIVTVDGGKASRIFNTSSAPTDSAIIIEGLSLIGGKAVDRGGAVRVGDESVTIRNCVLTGNEATTDGGAIAIAAPGAAKLVVEDCTLSGNISGRDGGAIYGGSGSKSIIIRRSTLSNNLATRNGGGALSPGYCTFLMEDSTVNANQSKGNASVTHGGGGLSLSGPNGTNGALVRNSTISGNTAFGNGGGILGVFNLSGVTLQNSTITNNTALGTKGGGGIAGTGVNTYYGYYTTPFSVQSCVISSNAATANANHDLFTLASVTATFSAIGSKTGASFFFPDATTTALLGADFKLGPLANNGGPTMTHALLLGSPCINTGSNPAALTTDQRGRNRTVGVIDIGAFELQPAAKVTAVVVGDGTAQRSTVTQVKVTFDSPLTFIGSPAAAFTLVRQSDSKAVTLAATVSGNDVTLTFTGGAVDYNSLADGRYTLSVLANQIGADGLDGDGNGNGGDDYTLIGNPATNKLIRFFGDSDGDGTVAANDFIQFRLRFGGSI